MSTKPKQIVPKDPKTTVPLLTRTVVFLAVCVLFSGLIGPRIISGGILYKDGFGIYGGAGKSLLFAALAFLLLAYRRGFDVQLRPWKPYNLIWLVLSALTFSGAWLSVSHLIQGQTASFTIICTHLFLLSSLVFAAGGVFGAANIRLLLRTYRRELLIALAIGVVFYGFLTLVYSLWKVLAAGVLHSVQAILGLFGLHSIVLPPRTLLFDKFGINIAQYCSGIESIALFTGLYTLVGVLDWPRLDHRRFLLIFAPALLVLFGFNILRVTFLIAAGYYLNPQIAFSLFHTYAGMVFFIIYSILFWRLSYSWLIRKN